MMVQFRNIDVDPDDPVQAWGFEGLLAAVDRGEVRDWRKIAAAVQAEPFGPVADTLAEVLEVAEDSGAAGGLRAVLVLVRQQQEDQERTMIAAEIGGLVRQSGLDQGAFARRIGTSRTRLNAYLRGATMPSARVMLRAHQVANRVEDLAEANLRS